MKLETGFGSCADYVAEENSEGETSFVVNMDSMERVTIGESEGLTIADIMPRADLESETLLEGVVNTSELLLC